MLYVLTSSRREEKQHPQHQDQLRPGLALDWIGTSRDHGGRDARDLPPGGPAHAVPRAHRRARAARDPAGREAGPEQTKRAVLLQVRGPGLRVSTVQTRSRPGPDKVHGDKRPRDSSEYLITKCFL